MNLHASLGLWKVHFTVYFSPRSSSWQLYKTDVHQTVLTVISLAPGVSSDI